MNTLQHRNKKKTDTNRYKVEVLMCNLTQYITMTHLYIHVNR